MKNLVFAMLTSLIAVSAHAQTLPSKAPAPSTTGASTATPRAGTAPEPGAPLPGANSFTETQAKARIEELGYSNVSALAKDANGIWRGSAMKDGRSHNVALDYRGNIVVSQK